MEASPITVGQLLGELFPGTDIAAGLERVHTALETLAKQIFAGIKWVCEMADRLEKTPPAPGYEPMLIERCHHPLIARGLSYWLIGLGKDEAYRATTDRIVVDALRFLAKPGRTQRSISRRATALLEVWTATGALNDAFHGSDISVLEFVAALEGAVRGEFAACRRVTDIAAALAPGLSVRRGPKVSEASVAHQLLLEYVANSVGPKSYTYSEIKGDFTDPLTRATRSAFDEPRFDPRPAFRRYRARQR
jgi:hypothetical protein